MLNVLPHRLRNMATLIFAIHIIALMGLFNVQYPAGDATILERYTARYALLLGGTLIVTLLWGCVALWHHQVSRWVARFPRWSVLVLGTISPFIVWGLWQVNVNRSATWFMMMSLYAIVIYVAHQQRDTLSDDMTQSRWMLFIMGLVALGLALGITLQALSAPAGYAPQDEAAWAELSTIYLRGDSTLYLDEFTEMIVVPGIGAGTVLFLGIPLQLLDFSPYMGRVLVIIGYLSGAFFVYLTTRRLSNSTGALISAILILSSMNLVQAHEFRPHHLLPALVGLLVWLVITLPSYDVDLVQPSQLSFMAFMIGFGAINGIQLHAVGVLYAFVFSSLFVLLWLWRWRTHRDIRRFFVWGIGPYGIGAILGLLIFWMVNIVPAGGLNSYLELISLTSGGGNYSFLPIYLTNVYGIYWRVDIVLMIAGWLGGLWLLASVRQQEPKRIVIVILWLLTMFFGLFFDSYGYPHLYVVFLAILGGLFVGDIYVRLAPTFAGHWVPFFIAIAVVPGVVAHLSWQDIGRFVTGQQAPLYETYATIAEQIEPYWTEDDMMLSTDLLLWSLWNKANWKGIYVASQYRRYHPENPPIQQWRDLGITMVAYVDDDSFVTSGRFGVMDGVLAYMRENDYWVCDEFQVDPYTISIYRPQADLASNYCPNPERIYDDVN